MEIFFHDPDDVPLPPGEVHIRQFSAKPYPDNRRLRVYLEISPFQKRPSAEISIYNPEGKVVASANVIETIDPRLEMTMHMRGNTPSGEYEVKTVLFYEELSEETDVENEKYVPPDRKIVDQARVTFLIE